MVSGTEADAQQLMDDLEAVGISYDDVVDVLEREGVEKFEASWAELVEAVQTALDEAKAGEESRGQGATPPVSDDNVVLIDGAFTPTRSAIRRTDDCRGSPVRACW